MPNSVQDVRQDRRPIVGQTVRAEYYNPPEYLKITCKILHVFDDGYIAFFKGRRIFLWKNEILP